MGAFMATLGLLCLNMMPYLISSVFNWQLGMEKEEEQEQEQQEQNVIDHTVGKFTSSQRCKFIQEHHEFLMSPHVLERTGKCLWYFLLVCLFW